MTEIYNAEFKKTLIEQACNDKDRYLPVPHLKLAVGDIILLKESNMKSNHYPMAIVTEIKVNNNGEVTDITARKGTSREYVKRHVTSVIPLFRPNPESEDDAPSSDPISNPPANLRTNTRKAAKNSAKRTAQLIAENLV